MANKKLLLLPFLFVFLFGFSQEKIKKIPLQDFLQETEKKIDVKFSFSVVDVAEIYISKPKNANSIAEIIDYLNRETNLQFTKIDNRFITVSKLNKVISICGKVLDFINEEPLSLASIKVNNSDKGITTDQNGRFSIPEIFASDEIIVSYLGYKPLKIDALDFKQKENCKIIYLEEQSFSLNEIVIRRLFTSGLQKNSDGSVTLNTEEFGILPGQIQPDILQTIKVLPGVESVDETVSNINVRGGTNDQNLIIWDGIKMYHYGHFFGLISAYNPYLTNKVSVVKNGTSSEFSDGVSSTILMETKNDLENEIVGGAGFDLLSADFFVRTPITNKLSVHFSARRSFTDYLNTPTYTNYFERSFQDNTVVSNEVNETETDFFFYDYSFKLLYNLNENQSFRANFINIKNNLDYKETYQENNNTIVENSNLTQENVGGSFFWNANWSDHFSSEASFFYSNYIINSSDFNRNSNQLLRRKNEVLESGFTLKTGYKITNNFQLNTGFDFNEIGVANQTSVNAPEFFVSDKKVLIKNALFTEAEFNNQKTYARIGLRANYFYKFDLFLFEPRVNIRQKMSRNFYTKLEAELKHQSIAQQIDFEDNFLGVEKRRWVLSDENNVPIIQSKQVSFGVEYALNNFQIDITGFYKKVENITVSNQGFYNNVQNLNAVGSYTSKGIELIANQKINNFSAWLSYTFAENDYDFDVFTPSVFPNNLDICHSLNSAINYNFNDQFKISLGSVLRTGKPFTKPVEGNETLQINNRTIVNYDSPNQERLPNFFRLDASVSYNFLFSKNIKGTFRAGITNMLNRKNTINSYYVVDENDDDNTLRINNTSLPFTPNVSFRVDF